ncbi:MAG TPA: hypothetical protein PKE45_26430 [Caldilineaceae bacterium]|nr:hypothetical protein [Caldilineaceae bacterium]
MSTSGDWQIRLTVQRSDQFDALVDFPVHVATTSAALTGGE